ncbi:MAG: NADH-quinone oxidoreductase subunit M [Magnetococcales bacterium]|nr:NADH-quinone oxidoreductase subunit M [Magnetococcales bacterium]
MTSNPFLLGWMQLLPVIGALGLLFIRNQRVGWWIALGCTVGELLLAWQLLNLFDPEAITWQWHTRLPVTRALVQLSGADGMTVLFVLLTSLLALLVVLYGGLVRRYDQLPRFFSVVLACEAALIGQFAALDLLWFILMAAIQTVCISHLFANWSLSSDERTAMVRYNQFMGTSLLLLLAAALMLGWNHALLHDGRWSFEWPLLVEDYRSNYLQTVIFYLLFYGLAIRLPLFPLHGWLPQVMEHGTVASAMVLLLGVKTGIYGIVRFVLPLFPDAVWQWHNHVIVFAVVGIFYSALLALVQTNLRKLLAYAVISHTGILVIGLFSLHPHAFQGSLMLTASFGLAISTLMLTAGMIHLRTRGLALEQLGGLIVPLPVVGVAFLVASLSVMGMPGTPGFDAVHLLLEAAIDRFGALVTLLAAIGNLTASACLLWAFQRAFLAAPLKPVQPVSSPARSTWLEQGLAGVLIVVQLVLGFHADPWLDLVKQTSIRLAAPYMESRDQP